MLESLRSRLLLWYTLVLMVLVGVYAGIVTYAYWRSLILDLDAALNATGEIIAASVSPDISGTFDLNFPPRFRETAFGPDAEGTYYILWNADGGIIDRSEFAPSTPVLPAFGAVTRSRRHEVTLAGPGGMYILVGRPLDGPYSSVRTLGLTIAAAGGIVLVLAFAGGTFLAGRALAPIARISATAGAMVGGDLTARIPVEDTDSELELVARALNSAFARLQMALEQQRRFTADASHEFRTPLATLRAEFEWALKRNRSDDEYRATIAKAHQGVQRLTDLADRLLILARGQHATADHPQTVDFAGVVNETVRLLLPIAQQHGVRIDTTVTPAWVSGDRDLLVNAISNLIMNAIRYNRPDGSISVIAGQDGDTAQVVVADTGVGIAQEDLPRIFERFYRADQSRGRAGGGAGLGLAIVKEIVDAHRGTVTCLSTIGVGTEVTVRLPVAGRTAATDSTDSKA